MTTSANSAEVRPGHRLPVRFVIDDWQGMTAAVLGDSNSGYQLASLVAWQGPRLRRRVYAIAPLDESTTEVFLRNMRSDYCDLTRHRMETEALIAAAGPAKHLVMADDGIVQAIRLAAGLKIPRYSGWQEISEDDSREYFSGFTP